MKIRILGCSGSATHGLDTTSFLINDKILIDAGTGVRKLSITELKNIESIFITHSHLDHVTYLPFIADALFDESDHSITIYCLKETELQLRKNIFNDHIWPDFLSIRRADKQPIFTIKNIVDGTSNKISGLNFESTTVNHTVPSLGIRVSEDDHSFAFTGDTTTNDNFWDMINSHPQLDLLIAECAFPNKMQHLSEIAGHYNPQTLHIDLKKSKHHTKTMISHLKAGYENEIMDEIIELTEDSSIGRLTDCEFYI